MIALICFVLASLTLAEWLCRTVDRINPARVLGPRYCFERGTSTPDSKIIRRLLQLRQNASVFAQGCADFSSDSSDRKRSFTPDPWWTSSPVLPNLGFRYTQVRRSTFRDPVRIDALPIASAQPARQDRAGCATAAT